MLRVTVELLPGGDESRRRLLGTATIANVSGGEIADYDVHVTSDDVEGVRHAVLKRYPRRASSVWDLVLRGICRTLTLHERLPKRPQPLSRIVPVRTSKTGIPFCADEGYSRACPHRICVQHGAQHLPCH